MSTAAIWTGSRWSTANQVYAGGWRTDALIGNGERWVPLYEPATGLAVLRSFPVSRSGSTLTVDYWGNRDALAVDASVTRAVLVVHGASRDARGYATSMMMAADIAGESATTAVVAPHFATDSEGAANPLRLTWGSQGWKQGDLSRSTNRPFRISTFEVADEVLAAMKAAFPNASDVLVIGHSAGGQFINRYVSAAAVPASRYIVANPSSYVYWDRTRFLDGGWREPTVQEQEACPEWNTYKYGLDGLNTYMTGIGTAAMRANTISRTISLLLGEADVLQDSALDTYCPAMMQGQHRLERGQRYAVHVQRSLGTVLPITTVPGVGHSARDMFTSPTGVTAVFG